MIVSRTPFRITLGGGGTDLEPYYSRYGGFVFTAAIDKYMYIFLNRPAVDCLIRVKYSQSEIVEQVSQLKHKLARAALEQVGIQDGIEICSIADIQSGTGLGSSSVYAVGLLNALHNLQRDYRPLQTLAEEAYALEKNHFNPSVGKQDHYIAAFGGLQVLDIARDGVVKVRPARISSLVIDELNRNTLIFFTGTTRDSEEILTHQSQSVAKLHPEVTDALTLIKELGHQILDEMERENIDSFGTLMHQHWETKKRISSKMGNPRHHSIYEIARKNGALGGKIAGAGGGGFFVFYTPNKHAQLRKAMQAEGLKELHYQFDLEGTRPLVHF